jgi:hypothetical protein
VPLDDTVTTDDDVFTDLISLLLVVLVTSSMSVVVVYADDSNFAFAVCRCVRTACDFLGSNRFSISFSINLRLSGFSRACAASSSNGSTEQEV